METVANNLQQRLQPRSRLLACSWDAKGDERLLQHNAQIRWTRRLGFLESNDVALPNGSHRTKYSVSLSQSHFSLIHMLKTLRERFSWSAEGLQYVS